MGMLGSTLLAAQAHAQCAKDTDCKGDRVCEQGQCVNPPPVEALPPPPPAPEAAAPAVPAPEAAAPARSGAPVLDGEPLADEQPTPRSYHRRSPALMTTGIVLTSSSLPFLLITASLSSSAYDDCIDDLPADYGSTYNGSFQDCHDSRQTRSLAIVLGTAALLGVGIPLIVYGAKKVPNSEQATLTPWASPKSAGLTLRLSL